MQQLNCPPYLLDDVARLILDNERPGPWLADIVDPDDDAKTRQVLLVKEEAETGQDGVPSFVVRLMPENRVVCAGPWNAKST